MSAIALADPKNVTALLSLANLDENAGDRAGAATRYRAVLEVDASNLFALNNLAYYLVLIDPEEASKLAQRAVELAPDNPTVQDTLGWVYCRKGNYGMALQCLEDGGCQRANTQAGVPSGHLLFEERQQGIGRKAAAKGSGTGPQAADEGTGMVVAVWHAWLLTIDTIERRTGKPILFSGQNKEN